MSTALLAPKKKRSTIGAAKDILGPMSGAMPQGETDSRLGYEVKDHGCEKYR